MLFRSEGVFLIVLQVLGSSLIFMLGTNEYEVPDLKFDRRFEDFGFKGGAESSGRLARVLLECGSGTGTTLSYLVYCLSMPKAKRYGLMT